MIWETVAVDVLCVAAVSLNFWGYLRWARLTRQLQKQREWYLAAQQQLREEARMRQTAIRQN